MQTFLILVAALALGYSGGYIALSSSRERELERLRQGINELLLELEYTAEESCERLVKERLKLEKLIAQMPGQKPKVASQPPLEPKTQAAPQPPPLWSRVAQLAQKGAIRLQ